MSETKSDPKPKKAKSTSKEAAAKRSATIAASRKERIEKRGYPLPMELTCSETGETVKYTSPAYIDKVIAKYGSLDKLKKNYISRKGKRIVAARTPKVVKAAKPAKTTKPAPAPKAPKKAATKPKKAAESTTAPAATDSNAVPVEASTTTTATV